MSKASPILKWSNDHEEMKNATTTLMEIENRVSKVLIAFDQAMSDELTQHDDVSSDEEENESALGLILQETHDSMNQPSRFADRDFFHQVEVELTQELSLYADDETDFFQDEYSDKSKLKDKLAGIYSNAVTVAKEGKQNGKTSTYIVNVELRKAKDERKKLSNQLDQTTKLYRRAMDRLGQEELTTRSLTGQLDFKAREYEIVREDLRQAKETIAEMTQRKKEEMLEWTEKYEQLIHDNQVLKVQLEEKDRDIQALKDTLSVQAERLHAQRKETEVVRKSLATISDENATARGRQSLKSKTALDFQVFALSQKLKEAGERETQLKADIHGLKQQIEAQKIYGAKELKQTQEKLIVSVEKVCKLETALTQSRKKLQTRSGRKQSPSKPTPEQPKPKKVQPVMCCVATQTIRIKKKAVGSQTKGLIKRKQVGIQTMKLKKQSVVVTTAPDIIIVEPTATKEATSAIELTSQATQTVAGNEPVLPAMEQPTVESEAEVEEEFEEVEESEEEEEIEEEEQEEEIETVEETNYSLEIQTLTQQLEDQAKEKEIVEMKQKELELELEVQKKLVDTKIEELAVQKTHIEKQRKFILSQAGTNRPQTVEETKIRDPVELPSQSMTQALFQVSEPEITKETIATPVPTVVPPICRPEEEEQEDELSISLLDFVRQDPNDPVKISNKSSAPRGRIIPLTQPRLSSAQPATVTPNQVVCIGSSMSTRPKPLERDLPQTAPIQYAIPTSEPSMWSDARYQTANAMVPVARTRQEDQDPSIRIRRYMKESTSRLPVDLKLKLLLQAHTSELKTLRSEINLNKWTCLVHLLSTADAFQSDNPNDRVVEMCREKSNNLRSVYYLQHERFTTQRETLWKSSMEIVRRLSNFTTEAPTLSDIQNEYRDKEPAVSRARTSPRKRTLVRSTMTTGGAEIQSRVKTYVSGPKVLPITIQKSGSEPERSESPQIKELELTQMLKATHVNRIEGLAAHFPRNLNDLSLQQRRRLITEVVGYVCSKTVQDAFPLSKEELRRPQTFIYDTSESPYLQRKAMDAMKRSKAGKFCPMPPKVSSPSAFPSTDHFDIRTDL